MEDMEDAINWQSMEHFLTKFWNKCFHNFWKHWGVWTHGHWATAESQCPQVELYKILWVIFIQMCANIPELRNFIVGSVRRSGAVRAHCEQWKICVNNVQHTKVGKCKGTSQVYFSRLHHCYDTSKNCTHTQQRDAALLLARLLVTPAG